MLELKVVLHLKSELMEVIRVDPGLVVAVLTNKRIHRRWMDSCSHSNKDEP